jgi:phosphoglycerate kinase
MTKASLRDVPAAELRGRPVLLRADLNVPLEGEHIIDDTRIRETVPTLRRLCDAGAHVIVLSHLGRPKGRPDPRCTLRPLVDRLRALLGGTVRFHPGLTDPSAYAAIDALRDGEVLVLENTRFDPGDEKNDPALADALARMSDLFVNDAFGAAHRAHASTSGVAERVRAQGGRAVAGLLMEEELEYLGRVLGHPERPFVAILGGAKISGKIEVIHNLLPRVDRLLIGGAMANTCFRALGLEVGSSLVEEDRIEVARATLEEAGDRLVLPVDCVVADRIEGHPPTRVVPRDSVQPGDRILDIGTATRALFARLVGEARTVFWNGPMGIFEHPPFHEGTVAVARAVAEATDRGALTVVGGGDSAAAAEAAGVTSRLSHVSTGGGASLEFLAGDPLPGVEALSGR